MPSYPAPSLSHVGTPLASLPVRTALPMSVTEWRRIRGRSCPGALACLSNASSAAVTACTPKALRCDVASGWVGRDQTAVTWCWKGALARFKNHPPPPCVCPPRCRHSPRLGAQSIYNEPHSAGTFFLFFFFNSRTFPGIYALIPPVSWGV